MTTFKVFSAGCSRCKEATGILQTAIDERNCGCTVQEISCDGACAVAESQGFLGKERPVIMRDNDVAHSGSLSKEQANALLPV
jgi:hypothetical protein